MSPTASQYTALNSSSCSHRVWPRHETSHMCSEHTEDQRFDPLVQFRMSRPPLKIVQDSHCIIRRVKRGFSISPLWLLRDVRKSKSICSKTENRWFSSLQRQSTFSFGASYAFPSHTLSSLHLQARSIGSCPYSTPIERSEGCWFIKAWKQVFISRFWGHWQCEAPVRKPYLVHINVVKSHNKKTVKHQ